LSELLDWDFLYEQTRTLYSHTGQPSLDPVLFFKLILNTVVCGCASSTSGAGRKAPVEPSFYRRPLRQRYEGVEVLARGSLLLVVNGNKFLRKIGQLHLARHRPVAAEIFVNQSLCMAAFISTMLAARALGTLNISKPLCICLSLIGPLQMQLAQGGT
jgi:hypothetical protein